MMRLIKITKFLLFIILGISLISFTVLRSWSIDKNEYPKKNNSPYQFPLKRESKSLCIQANNTLSTHKGEYKYSYDILLPMGTAIYASRNGIVKECLTTVGSLGFFKGNFVSVLRNDSTIAIYAHLKKNSIVVNVGDTVKTGDLIGYSGWNGMALYPHLQMHVLKNGQSIPFVYSDLQNESGMPEFLNSY